MNAKNIVVAGIVGGVILLILLLVFSAIANIVAPYDISKIGGMRAMNDPIMLLFFFYPFVLAFSAAVVFDVVKDALKGTAIEKGLTYGLLLFIILTIPGIFVMFSSMTCPSGFYLSQFLEGVIGYPIVGIISVKIWNL